MFVFTRWIIIMGIMLIGSGLVLPADIHVSVTADGGVGSLREAIHTANGNGEDDIIYLPAGTYVLTGESAENANLSGDLDIDNKNKITILGSGVSGTIIDGGGRDRIFHILEGTVVLSGIKICNGRAPDGKSGYHIVEHTSGSPGGGILNNGTLELLNCDIKDCGAGEGGYVEFEGTFKSCAGGDGGGVCNRGVLSMTGCRITGNWTGDGGNASDCYPLTEGHSGGDGGGVYNSGRVTMSRCDISGNKSGTGGRGDFGGQGGTGGGFFNADGATATAFRCSFSGNTTGDAGASTEGGNGGNGGGIFNEGDMGLARCTLSGNSTGKGRGFKGSGGSGGGIYNNSTEMLVITNCTVSGNSTGEGYGRIDHPGHGAGICNEKGGMVLQSCTVYDNRCGKIGFSEGQMAKGGGIYNFHPYSTITPSAYLSSTIVAGNGFDGTGEGPDCYGTIISNGYNLFQRTTDCTITGNTTGNITGQDPKLGPLADNGGETLTHALLDVSPCLDAGNSFDLKVDQRGNARTSDDKSLPNAADGTDIGAYELDNSGPSLYVETFPLRFGVLKTSPLSAPVQTFEIYNSGGGMLSWRIETGASWIQCSPFQGTGSQMVLVSVDASNLTYGTHSGVLTVYADDAANSPQSVEVSVTVYGTTQPPRGSFDTPEAGSTVAGAIAVTGWAIDDIGIADVKLYRSPGLGESGDMIYIDDAVFVPGARPDVGAAYPEYPGWRNAGWGYMLLTNFFPGGGNGTFTLYAVASDVEGNEIMLGSKTISVDNNNATKPFGTLDTPKQGDVVSGSSFVNFGWALTPQPNKIAEDGSTITVYVDGKAVGHPVYNQYRKDIATLFPGYTNSDGAVGYYKLDTFYYANGIHTLSWTVKDDAGNTDGIGSRFFTVRNYGAERSAPTVSSNVSGYGKMVSARPGMVTVSVRKGVNRDKSSEQKHPGEDGEYLVEIEELELLEIAFASGSAYDEESYLKAVYLEALGGKQPKPVGSSIDEGRGVFYWQPGPGFLGDYRLVFLLENRNGECATFPGSKGFNGKRLQKVTVTVRVAPKTYQ